MKPTGYTWTNWWEGAKDKSKNHQARNSRQGRYILDSSDEPSVKRKGFPWVSLVWLELGDMGGKRMSKDFK